MQAATKVRLGVNPVFVPAFYNEQRFLVLMGGAGSGKSRFIVDRHLIRAFQEKRRVLVTRRYKSTLRGSIFQEYVDSLSDNFPGGARVLTGRMEIQIPQTGSVFVFAGLDDVEKLKSFASPTDIQIEEATEVLESDVTQLNLRLRGKKTDNIRRELQLTFNPISHRSHLKKNFFDRRKANAMTLVSTYRNNWYLDSENVAAIEEIDNENVARIYRYAQWGLDTKGLIHGDWTTFDTLPAHSYDTVIGVDFGYVNPAAVVLVHRADVAPRPKLFVEQLLYQTRLTNTQLIERLKQIFDERSWNLDAIPMLCDSAEPDSIAELADAGFDARKSDKNVNLGIDTVNDHDLYLHEQAVDIQEEATVYSWAQDARSGEYLPKPVKYMDHAMNGIRYAAHTTWGRATRPQFVVVGKKKEE